MSLSAAPSTAVTGYVLAGGQSSRMGKDKALLDNDGERLLERAVATLNAVCKGTFILSGPRNDERDALLSCYAHLVPDPGQGHDGPVAGLIAALQHCVTPYACIVAVDQPDITPLHLKALCTAALQSEASAACFQRIDGRMEPLPAFLSAGLLSPFSELWRTGERRLLSAIHIAAQQFSALHRSNGKMAQGLIGVSLSHGDAVLSPSSLTNLNSPADLESWRSNRLSSTQSPLGASE